MEGAGSEKVWKHLISKSCLYVSTEKKCVKSGAKIFRLLLVQKESSTKELENDFIIK
jgi:hypothetical protein